MKLADTAWGLPSGQRFLADASAMVTPGGGLIAVSPAAPPRFGEALEGFFRATQPQWAVRRAVPDGDTGPATVVGDLFDRPESDLDSLLSDASLVDHVAIIDLDPGCDVVDQWIVFLRRFLMASRSEGGSVAIVLVSPFVACGAPVNPCLVWKNRLQRTDINIWADLHVNRRLHEPLASLAAATAVEVGGWRLDVVAALAASAVEDIFEPIEMLEQWRGTAVGEVDAVGREEIQCCVDLLEREKRNELLKRVWRAQLRILFPWVEEFRQQIIDRHRRKLIVTPEQRNLGVNSLEDIELGGLLYQLRSKVSVGEADLIAALARLRNDLAHRRAVAYRDVLVVLQGHISAGYG